MRVVGFVNSPLLSYRGAVHEGLVYVADWFSTLLNLAGDTGCPLGRVENRKSWKITKLQVDPIDAHKNKTICMI